MKEQGQPGELCLQEYMIGDKNDRVLLRLCSSFIFTYGKGLILFNHYYCYCMIIIINYSWC